MVQVSRAQQLMHMAERERWCGCNGNRTYFWVHGARVTAVLLTFLLGAEVLRHRLRFKSRVRVNAFFRKKMNGSAPPFLPFSFAIILNHAMGFHL